MFVYMVFVFTVSSHFHAGHAFQIFFCMEFLLFRSTECSPKQTKEKEQQIFQSEYL